MMDRGSWMVLAIIFMARGNRLVSRAETSLWYSQVTETSTIISTRSSTYSDESTVNEPDSTTSASISSPESTTTATLFNTTLYTSLGEETSYTTSTTTFTQGIPNATAFSTFISADSTFISTLHSTATSITTSTTNSEYTTMSTAAMSPSISPTSMHSTTPPQTTTIIYLTPTPTTSASTPLETATTHPYTTTTLSDTTVASPDTTATTSPSTIMGTSTTFPSTTIDTSTTSPSTTIDTSTTSPSTTTTTSTPSKTTTTHQYTTTTSPDTTTAHPDTTTTTTTSTTTATTTTSPTSTYTTKTPLTPEHTTTQFTTTTPAGTTTAPVNYSTPIDSLSLKVDLTVSINTTFNNELTDKDSDDYKKLSSEFKTQLSGFYKNATGFLYVRITGFSKGSIHCNFEAVFEASTNLSVVANETKQKQLTIDGHVADTTAAVDKIIEVSGEIATGSLCTVMTDTCSTGYECQGVVDGYILCVHQCLLDSPKCGVHGHCYYDTSFKSTKCRCTETDDAIYGGPNCNNKIEKLAMSSTAIISIAAGCGGGMAAILVSAILCLVIRNKRLKKGLKNRESFTELDNEGMMMKRLVSSQQLERHQNVLMGGNDRRNMYDDRPRAHGSLASIYGGDDVGRSVDSRIGNAEGYMYIHPQGSDEPLPGAGTYIDLHSTNRDNQSVISSVYDQIDTTTKFAIRRPQITPRPDYF